MAPVYKKGLCLLCEQRVVKGERGYCPKHKQRINDLRKDAKTHSIEALLLLKYWELKTPQKFKAIVDGDTGNFSLFQKLCCLFPPPSPPLPTKKTPSLPNHDKTSTAPKHFTWTTKASHTHIGFRYPPLTMLFSCNFHLETNEHVDQTRSIGGVASL